MSVRLILLAGGIALNIFMHKLCEAWPPKLRGDELASLEITGVAGSLVVMAAGKDGAMEGVLWGNVDMAFVGQDVVVIFPVREAGLEGGGDVL